MLVLVTRDLLSCGKQNKEWQAASRVGDKAINSCTSHKGTFVFATTRWGGTLGFSITAYIQFAPKQLPQHIL